MARPARSPVSRPRRTARSGFPQRLKDELVYSEADLVRDTLADLEEKAPRKPAKAERKAVR